MHDTILGAMAEATGSTVLSSAEINGLRRPIDTILVSLPKKYRARHIIAFQSTRPPPEFIPRRIAPNHPVSGSHGRRRRRTVNIQIQGTSSSTKNATTSASNPQGPSELSTILRTLIVLTIASQSRRLPRTIIIA